LRHSNGTCAERQKLIRLGGLAGRQDIGAQKGHRHLADGFVFLCFA
jgi:hypothetical protein